MKLLRKIRDKISGIISLPFFIFLYLIYVIVYAVAYVIAYFFFDYKISEWKGFDLTTFFLVAAGIMAFFIWTVTKVTDAFKIRKAPVLSITIFLLVISIFNYAHSYSYRSVSQGIQILFDSEFYEELFTLLVMIDIGAWILAKFAEAYAERRFYRKSDPDNPKNIKNDIERLISDCGNIEAIQKFKIEKLCKMLQVSTLSIKKQKRIIRFSLLNNFLISLLFFVLGLIIPKLITFFAGTFH